MNGYIYFFYTSLEKKKKSNAASIPASIRKVSHVGKNWNIFWNLFGFCNSSHLLRNFAHDRDEEKVVYFTVIYKKLETELFVKIKVLL